ncbi:MAG: DegV family protein [Lachnospiraceae bacterium]|nr:DegV family protein [Lachnospiraceae bacterium]
MSYKIVVDSCGELPETLMKDEHFESVPLEIFVDDYHITDDETFDQAEFLRRVRESPNCPKSTCPSPERYMEAYDCAAKHVYAVTLSARLSGSCNSAQLGRKLYLEEKGEKQIHIFDSKSASVGQTLIAMKIQECEKEGLAFAKIVQKVEAYIEEMNTSFVLETLETLRKNGRLSNIKAFVASALNIKPVMGATPEGMICQLSQARGMVRAIDKMIADLVEKTKNPQEKIFAISHCNAPKRAREAAEKVKQMGNFKEVFVLDTAGISSMYASDGGIIMAV